MDTCQAMLELVEGEPERARLIDALALFLNSADDEVQECAVEAIQALAATEPQSFTYSQIDSLEGSLIELISSPQPPFDSEDALAAVRHARLHVTT